MNTTTKLQHMVYLDAFKRVQEDHPNIACGISYYQVYDIPDDVEIKAKGYEGAVETVYQQMIKREGVELNG